MSDNLTNKISDIKRLSGERKSGVSEWAYRSGTLWINPVAVEKGGPNTFSGTAKAPGSSTNAVELPKSFGKGLKTSNSANLAPIIKSSETNEPPASRMSRTGGGRAPSPTRKTPQSGVRTERPASRMEVNALEKELEDRVRLVLDMHEELNSINPTDGFSKGYSFEPHRETMMLVRDRMLKDFGMNAQTIHDEPWLDTFIKCECMKVMCDEVSSKFADILSINSVQLGTVLRKLRLTYKQCFEQVHSSWKDIRKAYLDSNAALGHRGDIIEQLQNELLAKERDMNQQFDREIHRLNEEFNKEKKRDEEKLTMTEFKMDQMSDTLKYLNGIFKTMQSDNTNLKNADLQSKCTRLEKENADLQRQNASLDQVKSLLAASEQRVRQLEKDALLRQEEVKHLNHEIERREEVLKGLMEREALRNAEIEKLQKISKMKEDEMAAVDLKDSATSVLCIKCKRSLDDMTNIRSAVMGSDGPTKVGNIRSKCEGFRILLPNLKGRKPNRTAKWLRSCIRCILFSKLREDVNLHFIKGHTTNFPAYVYSWFVRNTETRTGAQLTKQLVQADEDRWGLYYGVKALSKDDPEASLFWSLLDEAYGNDGMHFVHYCLSVVLSIGGKLLWKQLGSALELVGSINVKPADDESVRNHIWLDIDTAKEAVKLILVRAMQSHVMDAVDAIDAMKVKPTDIDLKALQMMAEEETIESIQQEQQLQQEQQQQEGNEFGDSRNMEEASAAEQSTAAGESVAQNGDTATVDGADEIGQTLGVPINTVSRDVFEDPVSADNFTNSAANQEPTHINLFLWLRLMMQQMQADQIQRAAAVRLMFETASVGALTPQAPGAGGASSASGGGGGGGSAAGGRAGTAGGESSSGGTHVEYPQFQSICQTLFPLLATSEVASLYADCHELGKGRVSSEIFVKVADKRCLFVHALKLPSLPLLRNYKEAIAAAPLIAPGSHFTGRAEGDGDDGGGVGGAAISASGSAKVVVMNMASRSQSSRQVIDRSSSGGVGGAEEDVELSEEAKRQQELNEARALENSKRVFTRRTEQAVRSKLATVVHRKLAAMIPAIRFLMAQLPERWRSLLADAIDDVQITLNDSHQKLRQQQQEQLSKNYNNNTATTDNPRATRRRSVADGAVVANPQRSYADGLQPFFAYRRLILLASLVKSLCDNPLLPTELFSAHDLENKDINIDQAMYRGELILTNLEETLLLAPGTATATKSAMSSGVGTISKIIDRYHNFERVRKTLIARRLQNVARKFLGRDVAVPRAVRMCLSAGYLGAYRENASTISNILKADSVGAGSPPGGKNFAGLLPMGAAVPPQKPKLNTREVYHDPWWGMAQVAEIYRFKITYDLKAASLGLNPLTLAQAAVATQYYIWGSMEFAERAVHDIFVSVRAYRFGIPRLRLFAAFLGDGRDLEDSVATMLRTPHAVSVYFNLLMELHRELSLERGRMNRRLTGEDSLDGDSQVSADDDELAQMGVTGADDANGAHAASDRFYSTELPDPQYIPVLFPATEDALKRHDKRDIWNCSVHLLVKVAERWALRQSYLHGAVSIYSELPEKLRANPLGEAEVDDFLWIMMVQWAKLAYWLVKRSTKASNSVERSHPVAKYEVDLANAAAAIMGGEDAAGNGDADQMGGMLSPLSKRSKVVNRKTITDAAGTSYKRHKVLKQKASYSRLPQLPVSSLKTIVESVYRPGEGALISDAQHYAASYMHRIGICKENLNVPVSDAASFDGNSTRNGAIRRFDDGKANNAAPVTKFSVEMEKLLKECALWDTTELSSAFRYEVDIIANAAIDIGGLKASPKVGSKAGKVGSKSGTGAAALTATASAGSAAVAEAAGGGGAAGTVGSEFAATAAAAARAAAAALHAVNPEIWFAIARTAFVAYQHAIKDFFHVITDHHQLSQDPDIEQRVQSLRIIMLSLAEMLHEKEPEYTSFKIHAHDANASSDSVLSEGLRENLQHLQMICTPATLVNLYATREKTFNINRQAWSLLQALMSGVSELAIITGQDMPRDAWNGGAKVHVDRAFVYSIHTKNALS